MTKTISGFCFECGRNKINIKTGDKVEVTKDGNKMGVFEIVFWKSMFCAKSVDCDEMQFELIEPLHRDAYFESGGDYDLRVIDI